MTHPADVLIHWRFVGKPELAAKHEKLRADWDLLVASSPGALKALENVISHAVSEGFLDGLETMNDS